jgi:hypothetical protein
MPGLAPGINVFGQVVRTNRDMTAAGLQAQGHGRLSSH